MHSIYKYELKNPVEGDSEIEIPVNSCLTYFGYQKHPYTGKVAFCVWMEVDLDEEEKIIRKFQIVPTGGIWEPVEWYLAMSHLDHTGHVWNLLETWPEELEK